METEPMHDIIILPWLVALASISWYKDGEHPTLAARDVLAQLRQIVQAGRCRGRALMRVVKRTDWPVSECLVPACLTSLCLEVCVKHIQFVPTSERAE